MHLSSSPALAIEQITNSGMGGDAILMVEVDICRFNISRMQQKKGLDSRVTAWNKIQDLGEWLIK
jgi:hypothetical protein